MATSLGEAVLTLKIDESGLVTGMVKAEKQTKDFTEKSEKHADGFKQKWDAAMGVLSAAGVMMAWQALKKLVDIGTEMLNTWAEQERALVTLTAALATNSKATDTTVHSLAAWAEQMQDLTIFSDDLIESQMVLLASMGMGEDQIKRVMTAAMNLASTGMVTLDQAVRGLASSYEGSLGPLTRSVPAMKSLTEEQLKHGAAIEWIERIYPNMAETVAKTTYGLQQQMNNLVGDQKEKLGEVIANAYQGVSNMRDTIKAAGTIGAQVLAALIKSIDTLVAWLKFGYDAFWGMMRLLVDLTVAVAKTIWAPIEYAFHDVIIVIKNWFVVALNWIIQQANVAMEKIGEGLMKITGGLIGKKIAQAQIAEIKLVVDEGVQPLGETIEKIWADAGAAGTRYVNTMVNDVARLGQAWTTEEPTIVDTINNVQDAVQGTTDAVEELVDVTRPAVKQMADDFDDTLTQQVIPAVEATAEEIADLEAANSHMVTESKTELKELSQQWKDTFKTVSDIAISSIRSVMEDTGRALAQGELTWKSFGESVIKVIGKIVSTLGDELAASAAADLVKAAAALLTVFGAGAAPGYFASAAIKSAGAAAAWLAGGALQAVKLERGGEFDVPPGYPQDSFPIAVSSGEHVEVTPASERGGTPLSVQVILDGKVLANWLGRATRNQLVRIHAGAIV